MTGRKNTREYRLQECLNAMSKELNGMKADVESMQESEQERESESAGQQAAIVALEVRIGNLETVIENLTGLF